MRPMTSNRSTEATLLDAMVTGTAQAVVPSCSHRESGAFAVAILEVQEGTTWHLIVETATGDTTSQGDTINVAEDMTNSTIVAMTVDTIVDMIVGTTVVEIVGGTTVVEIAAVITQEMMAALVEEETVDQETGIVRAVEPSASHRRHHASSVMLFDQMVAEMLTDSIRSVVVEEVDDPTIVDLETGIAQVAMLSASLRAKSASVVELESLQTSKMGSSEQVVN